MGGAIKRQLGSRHDITAPRREEADILDPRSVAVVVARVRPDWIINAAAYNNVDGAEGDGAGAAFLLNATAAGVIADAAHAANAKLLHVSTDYVFAGDKKDGYVEDDEPAPMSAYGASKWLGELMALRGNPQTYVVRTSRLYGPPAESPEAKKSFVDIVRELADRERSFSINDAEVSAPTSVDDLARHLDEQLLSGGGAAPGIYHMANGGGCTWYEWAREIVSTLGLPAEVTPRDPSASPRPAKRPAFSVLRSTKLPAMRPWQDAFHAFLKEV